MNVPTPYNGNVGRLTTEKVLDLFMSPFIFIPTVLFVLGIVPFFSTSIIGPNPSWWKVALMFLTSFGVPLALLLVTRMLLKRKTFTCEHCHQEAQYEGLQYQGSQAGISYSCPHCKFPVERYYYPCD